MLPVLIHIGTLRIYGRTFGGFDVAVYGLMALVAFAAPIVWLQRSRERMGLSEPRFWRLIYALFFSALGGAKLLYVLLAGASMGAGGAGDAGGLGRLEALRYGWVFYGGFAAAVAAGWIAARRWGLPFAKLSDYFGVALPLGQSLGRLGCLAAGCCYGRPSGAPWALRFTNPNCLVPEGLLGVPLHPTQLYESFGDLAIAGVVRSLLCRIEAGRLKSGTAFCAYLGLYAALRLAVEFFRGDDRGGAGWILSPSQWAALACLSACGVWSWRGGLWRGGSWSKNSA